MQSEAACAASASRIGVLTLGHTGHQTDRDFNSGSRESQLGDLLKSKLEERAGEPEAAVSHSWIGYVAPMGLFMALTVVEGQMPAYYVWLYILKAVLVTGCLYIYRSTLRDYRFDARMLLPGIIVGLVVCAEWLLIDQHILYPHLGKRSAFDPHIIAQPLQTIFLLVRFYGLVVMVPVMEELFWRSFLIRYITQPDYERLSIGTFSWVAFWAVSGMFALAHPEWLVALICAVVYGLLLRRTKSLFATLVAHSVTNLTLGIYVLATHNYAYW